MEAILPIELVIPSLGVIVGSQVPKLEWAMARYVELITVNERLLRVFHDVKIYQA